MDTITRHPATPPPRSATDPNRCGMTTLVSILIPVLNDEANVCTAYYRVCAVFDGLDGYEMEVIFADNHSEDRTFDILSEMSAADERVRLIRFSRNVGYQKSVLAAYRAAQGACAVQLECDMRDPPELIPQMLDQWRQGHHVVYGVRKSPPDGPIVAANRRASYALIDLISNDDLPRNAGEFRLTDRHILDELRQIDDQSSYVRRLICGMELSQIGFDDDRQARTARESKSPFKVLLSLVIDGLINHSLLPLRSASIISTFVGLSTFLLLIGYIVDKFIFGADWLAGFATTTILLLLSMTLNAMFPGIMGEYIGRIFLQSKGLGRPLIDTGLNGGHTPPDHARGSPDRARIEAAEWGG